MKIIRYKYNTYNVIDRVYNNDKLQFEQTSTQKIVLEQKNLKLTMELL